jgi:hypothetical protein
MDIASSWAVESEEATEEDPEAKEEDISAELPDAAELAFWSELVRSEEASSSYVSTLLRPLFLFARGFTIVAQFL